MEDPKPSDELFSTLVRDICSVEWQVRTKAEYRRRIQEYGDARVREAMEKKETPAHSCNRDIMLLTNPPQYKCSVCGFIHPRN